MDVFDRSPLGRSNRSLFYNVDRVVYVEGGRDDKGPVESFDGLFWRRVFSTLRPELRLKILPRGSKDTLLDLASSLTELDVEHVIVAMDRDYDGLRLKLIDKPNVIYTYGYSYENDIFCRDSLVDLYNSLCPNCDDTVNIAETVDALIDDYCSRMWWAQVADVCGVIVARKVIDRSHTPKYLISSAYGSRPKISKSAFCIDVYKANTGSRPRVTGVPLKRDDLPELSVGHLYATYCFRLISYLHFLYSNTQKMTRDGVVASAIANFSNHLRDHPASKASSYYLGALATA